MFTISPFPHDDRMEREAILADYWDAEFPNWQEREADPERFVSEHDYMSPVEDDRRATDSAKNDSFLSWCEERGIVDNDWAWNAYVEGTWE